MTSGIEVTFRVLAHTKNEAALPWLAAALKSDHALLRSGGVRAILARHCEAGYSAIVENWHRLSPLERQILVGHGGQLATALRHGLLGTDSQLNMNAFSMVVYLREYDQIPMLVAAAQNPANPRAPLAARATLVLAEFLNAELFGPRDYSNRRDPALIRQSVYGCLEEAVRRFDHHGLTPLVEAFLLLAPKDDSYLRHLITDPNEPAYRSVIDQFLSSQRTGILRLILELLGETFPPAAVLSVLQRRHDESFRDLLLSHRPDRWSPGFRENLRSVTTWPWLADDFVQLDTLSDEGLSAAVQLIAASGVDRTQVFAIVKRVLICGGIHSRRAAMMVLDEFPGSEANRLVTVGLDDPDPEVQTLAVGRLHGRNLAGARTRLIELLDCPHESVVAAVRHELAEFTFPRFVSGFAQLEEEVRRAVGPLVWRVDPDAIELLRLELTSLSRARRLRALEVAVAMQVASAVADEILTLSGDPDHFVRAATVPALLSIHSDRARRRLEELQLDATTATRQAAGDALHRLLIVPNPFAELTTTPIADTSQR